uniref:Major facilitator superfamily (MFS) profile domain-containing protein n=1 Tax=Phlebotomus papatasi TaxID=29031 RepID=A0A1B0DR73_PHLPP
MEFTWKLYKSRRYIVTAMSLLGFFNAYTTNVSFNVAIVAMTQKVNVVLENGTTIETQEFDWNSKEQGLLLSSIYYGYICTQVLGGILAERFSGHITDFKLSRWILVTVLENSISLLKIYLKEQLKPKICE